MCLPLTIQRLSERTSDKWVSLLSDLGHSVMLEKVNPEYDNTEGTKSKQKRSYYIFSCLAMQIFAHVSDFILQDYRKYLKYFTDVRSL